MTQPVFSSDSSHLNSSPCLQGERVTFTGILASTTHAEAAKLVEENGGTATDHVSRQLTMIVIGEEGWPLEDNGQPSVKLQQVERWIQSGADIQILNESQWLTLLGLNDHREEVHRLYTPAMLSSILGISTHVIRGWERSGLIQPIRKVHRLPYFDFREVSSARRLSELLGSGIPRQEIEKSLKSLPSVRRGDERPLEQLQILAHSLGVMIRDHHGLVMPATGQRVFEFETEVTPSEVFEDHEDDPQSISIASVAGAPTDFRANPNRDWLVEGCRLYDAGQIQDALEAFRLAAMSSPQSSDVHFQLGECLYRLGSTEGALERYYVAAEHDQDFLEAWTQIGCLHNELGENSAAANAFQVALTILPEYPDAHYHLAETLNQMGKTDVARLHWEEYLKHDHRGPWADVARQRIEQLGELDD
ncbi:tetratricopeptide repeat protein [Thalassoglobus sp.]|uniref:tetratricopeptide repeat protein n=1 Tax=Thalassoglobus sp. TaxID=2795869 RepID=UPI003AA8C7F8